MVRCSDGQMVSPTGGRIPTTTLTRPLASHQEGVPRSRASAPVCCRHTWATWHCIANRDLTKLQALGGWKTLSMVLRYAHTNVDEHKGSIDAPPGGNPGESKPRRQKGHVRNSLANSDRFPRTGGVTVQSLSRPP